MSDICVGPNGGCPFCYRRPCICRETEAETAAREARERKRMKAHGTQIETLECQACKEYGVVPDDVRREYICLKCGHPQVGFSQQALQAARVDPSPQQHTVAQSSSAVAPWVGTYAWQPRVEPSPPARQQNYEDLTRALLRVARFIEGILAKQPIDLDYARTTLRLVHDMQREARDGTLKLVDDSEALRAALVAPTLPLENQDTKDIDTRVDKGIGGPSTGSTASTD